MLEETNITSKEEIEKRIADIRMRSENLRNERTIHSEEEKRIINVLHNAETILNELDDTFEKRTSLSKTDISFLWVATALQLLRIYLLPKFQEKFEDENRLDHNNKEKKNEVKKKQDEYKSYHGKNGPKQWKSKKSEKGYRSWQEIAFTTKVPYDAQNQKDDEINMHGGKHRLKSLGHDPVLGWVFGVANIITDSITICPEYNIGEKNLRIPMVKSYKVDMDRDLYFKDTDKIPTSQVFKNCKESIDEDIHRLYAAVFAQGLHLASDKYSKEGLPIPFLSLIDADSAYGIYRDGYDYLDYLYDTQIIRRTFKSAGMAMTINKIIGCIHNFFYNPSIDYDRQLYHVRTRKILLYSNTIATSSDIIQTACGACIGDENALNNFDLGGFLVTVYRLISDMTFIQKVKEEFIFQEWDRIIESKDNILTI